MYIYIYIYITYSLHTSHVCVLFCLIVSPPSSLWRCALVSSLRGVLTPLYPCGRRSENQRMCPRCHLPWQLCSPSPPPFTIPSSICSSSPTSASPCVGTWHSLEAHCAPVCADRIPFRRNNCSAKYSITPQGCPTGCRTTTAPADTIPRPALRKPAQTTLPRRPRGY